MLGGKEKEVELGYGRSFYPESTASQNFAASRKKGDIASVALPQLEQRELRGIFVFLIPHSPRLGCFLILCYLVF